jgi:hypothetical protein
MKNVRRYYKIRIKKCYARYKLVSLLEENAIVSLRYAYAYGHNNIIAQL